MTQALIDFVKLNYAEVCKKDKTKILLSENSSWIFFSFYGQPISK